MIFSTLFYWQRRQLIIVTSSKFKNKKRLLFLPMIMHIWILSRGPVPLKFFNDTKHIFTSWWRWETSSSSKMILKLFFIVPMDSKNRKNIILIFLILLLKVLSSEIDQAKSGLIWYIFIKWRGARFFANLPAPHPLRALLSIRASLFFNCQ